jgi:ApbE superfamily uncharacterized protein (UPF0280 family)
MAEKLIHRFYREQMQAEGLVSFQVVEGESDLFIWAGRDLAREARESLLHHRGQLQEFIAGQPMFKTTYRPYDVPGDAPQVVALMAGAAEKVGVGPMAAVAGALAEAVGRDILSLSPEIMVENGGDIYIHSRKQRRVGVFAGESPLSGKLALLVPPTPPHGQGVCTSSAEVGPSYSAGKADAAMVVAENAALADAAATALGNRAKSPSHIKEALAWAAGIEGVTGCLLIIGEHLGVQGPLELDRT